MEAFKQLRNLCFGFTLQCLGHHRSRCGRNGAAGALKGHIPHGPVLHVHVDRDLVATERVVALGNARALEPPEVARPLAVVDDHFLLQLAQLGTHANTSRTLWIPATSASISACALSRPKQA